MTAKVVPMPKRPKKTAVTTERTTITPAMSYKLLEANSHNRPLSQPHVNRIAGQIKEGKWRFNGDTIKVSVDDDVLDGQHRLWAIITADKSVETIIVRGIEREAFATIDTLRKPRGGADVLALCGLTMYRKETAPALAWLLRWQRGALPSFRRPEHRIENSDIEEAYAEHPGMVGAVERVNVAKRLCPPSLLAFLYYAFSNRDEEMADRFIDTLESPAGVSIDDPFFVFRSWLAQSIGDRRQRRPVVIIALAFKAWNAVIENKPIKALAWRRHGDNPEAFPEMK